jgi:response regulator RpfG family c-di-GMP phosphodiesterase
MVFNDFRFENRPITFFSAYSGAETIRVMDAHPETAVILLDVVMETETAGLDVVSHIRQNLQNKLVRIVLRTGQPGKAPQRSIFDRFDINDYKEKTELTAQKLFTTVTAALRSFRDLTAIEKNRRGLQKVLDASTNLYRIRALKPLAQGALQYLSAILGRDEIVLHLQPSGAAATVENQSIVVLAATGNLKRAADVSDLPPRVRSVLQEACIQKRSLFQDKAFIGYFPSRTGAIFLIYLSGCKPLAPLEQNLIRVFSANLAVAFDNYALNREIIDTQQEVITILGDVAENRSSSRSRHATRVAEGAFLLARLAGMKPDEALQLRMAAPLHDLGKVGIPDAILLKPDRLTSKEHDIVEQHARFGSDLLKKSAHRLLQTAAALALQHHENWDGTGYPEGRKGQETVYVSRIVSLVDTFDALTHPQVYRKAWSIDQAMTYITKEREKRFDPALVDLFLQEAFGFIDLNDRFPDG